MTSKVTRDELWAKFRLPPVTLTLLDLLMQHDVVPAEFIEQHCSGQAYYTVLRLRRALEKDGHDAIKISSRRAVGYWLEPEVKQYVEAIARSI